MNVRIVGIVKTIASTRPEAQGLGGWRKALASADWFLETPGNKIQFRYTYMVKSMFFGT